MWNTLLINEYDRLYKQGKAEEIFRQSPYVKGMHGLRKPGLRFEYTQKELETKQNFYFPEYAKENDMVLDNTDGDSAEKVTRKVSLFGHQENLVKKLRFSQWNAIHNFPQSGIILAIAGALLDFVVRESGKCALVVNKFEGCMELREKFVELYKALPFHLRPGVTAFNQRSMRFDNGCSVKFNPYTLTSGIGTKVDWLLLMNLSRVGSTQYRNVTNMYYPALSQAHAITLQGDFNGKDWYSAVVANPESKFDATVLEWRDHPQRDQRWYDNMLKRGYEASELDSPHSPYAAVKCPAHEEKQFWHNEHGLRIWTMTDKKGRNLLAQRAYHWVDRVIIMDADTRTVVRQTPYTAFMVDYYSDWVPVPPERGSV